MLSNAIGVELQSKHQLEHSSAIGVEPIQASAGAFLCNSLKEMWHVALQHDACIGEEIKQMRSIVQAFVVVGDNNGHVGLGVKCAKEVGPWSLFSLQSSSHAQPIAGAGSCLQHFEQACSESLCWFKYHSGKAVHLEVPCSRASR